MSKHTPGPWEFGKNDLFIKPPDGKPVFHESRTAEEWEANTRLVAAAPELLEACEAAADVLFELNVRDETAVMIQAAIAKAKGETERE